MVAKMLQKSKFLLYVLYSCYVKFYFDYIFHIYVIRFIMYLLYIYMYIICFLILLYITVFILFDFHLFGNVLIFIICTKLFHYMKNSYSKKYLCFNNSNFLCYMKFFIIWFSHVIRLVKFGRQFIYKILHSRDFIIR